MLNADQINQLEGLFPVFRHIAADDRRKIMAAGQITLLAKDQLLIQYHERCQYIPFVLSGILRIFKLSPNGREMTLYRIGPGETCLISIACQIKDEAFPALAQTDEDAQLFLLPVNIYHEVLEGKSAWKDFLITTLYDHLTVVIETLEAVAFDRTDRRLVLWLLDRTGKKPGILRYTHEAVAVELGTAREVVSRLLGELKNKGMVRLGRGRIEVIDPARLAALIND
jgi:CRP/FNR family transcriptional regulator